MLSIERVWVWWWAGGMRRRDFIQLTVGSAIAWPCAVNAQQPAIPVVGFLNGATPTGFAAYAAAFRRGLGEVGYVEGQNVAIEYRWAEGHYDRFPELASDLVRRQVAVVFASGGGHIVATAAKLATTTIPIVFVSAGDLVKLGLVASLNRPGGNATGISLLAFELTAKRLEVLRELVPAAKTIAFLVNPTGVIADSDIAATLSVAQGLGLQVTVLKASTASEIDHAFASLAERRVDALLPVSDAFLNSRRDQLTALIARQAIPTVFDTRIYTEAGGLASYGPDYAIAYREAGAYTGRILHGAKPADLPVVQLSNIELVINLKTAKALGIAVPQSLLGRADEVIE